MTERVAPRDVIGKKLTELGRKNPKVVCVDADFNVASKINR